MWPMRARRQRYLTTAMRLRPRLWFNGVLCFAAFITVFELMTKYSTPITSYTFTRWNITTRLLTQDQLAVYAPFSKNPSIDCAAIFEGDPEALRKAKEYESSRKVKLLSDEYVLNMTKDCELFRWQRGYANQPLSEEERQFPIAYTILVYKNVEELERLLRAIYQPQNAYCIHVDLKATREVQQAVASLARCFSNVQLATQRERVVYASISRLQAEMHCMTDLLRSPVPWTYLINLASQEFPLQSSRHVVRILKMLRGKNMIESRVASRNLFRFTYAWDDTGGRGMRRLEATKGPAPLDMKIVKGSAYGIFSRPFLDFAIHSDAGRQLYNWSRDTYSPDEHFWATLNANTQFDPPGGHAWKQDPSPFLVRYVNWGEYPCQGSILRGICVFGLGDLPMLLTRPEMFANKFSFETEKSAYECMEELLFNRTHFHLPGNFQAYRQLEILNNA